MSEHETAVLVARHLTWGGEYYKDDSLTVDVTEGVRWSAECRACTDRFSEIPQRRAQVSGWAMAHAAACRALPKAVA